MTTYLDLPSRQKSQRLINRMKNQQQQQQFQQYKQRAKNIANINELLPGLNDISDAFEVLPMDLIKYFTLLKEIDAKCINTVPQINFLIKKYIGGLHEGKLSKDGAEGGEDSNENNNDKSENDKDKLENDKESKETSKRDLELRRLTLIKDKINEIIPCLEEKMHVTSVATDLLSKHMFRINNDYKLIVNNNEIPESIRIGPLSHPAMIMDANVANGSSVDRSAQAQRSESRREALAAKKASKEDNSDDHLSVKKKKNKESTPSEALKGTPNGNPGVTNTKKRSRKENDDIQRPVTPGGGATNGTAPAKKKNKPKKEDDSSNNSRANNTSSNNVNSNELDNDDNNTIDRVKAEVPASKAKNTGEPTYCYCNQVSFGEMVGCDGDDCKREWFHLPCIGFKNPPKGKWYCDDCLVKMKKMKKL